MLNTGYGTHKFDETHFMLTRDGMKERFQDFIKHRPLHIKKSINFKFLLKSTPFSYIL